MRGGEYKGWERKSFGSFVKIVLGQARRKQDVEYLGIDAHWRPFNAHCFFCKVKYTVISKMETLEEDREMILRMVGAEDVVSMKKTFHNKVVGKNIEEVTKELFSELTREEGEALADIKYDLEMFGYDADIYLDMTKQEYKSLG